MSFQELVKAAYPAQAPAAAARLAASDRMASAILATRRKVRVRRTVWGLALATPMVVAGVVMGPSAYALYRLNLINGSVSDVKTALIEGFNVGPDGTLTKVQRVVYAKGMWRLEFGGHYTIYRDGISWFFDPSAGSVTKKTKPDGPFTYSTTGFNVRSMISDMARWNWKQKIEVGTGNLDGRSVERVWITDQSNRERIVVDADPSSHLPLQYRIEAHSLTGWRVGLIQKPTFDGPVDEKEFSIEIPKGMRVIDEEREQKEWVAKLEKPIASFTFGSHKVAIRDVAVNPRGHIFVLYTSGETVKDRQAYTDAMRKLPQDGKPHVMNIALPVHPDVEVADSAGVTYTNSRSSLQPYVGSYVPSQSRGIVLADGEILQGAWLVPLEERPWQPHRFTLKLTVFDKGKTQMEKWVLNAPKPTSPITPLWVSHMGLGPREDWEILREERLVQRSILKDKGDWAQVEAGLRLDLEDVLAQERKGLAYAKGTVYYELYDALSHQGKRPEALEFLKLASKEAVYSNQYPAPEIEAAMKKEGL